MAHGELSSCTGRAVHPIRQSISPVASFPHSRSPAGNADPHRARASWKGGTWQSGRGVRIESAQARHQALHLDLEGRRGCALERIANLLIEIDELLRVSKVPARLAIEKAHVAEQLGERG